MKVFTISDSYLQVVQGTIFNTQVEPIALGLLGQTDPNSTTITYTTNNNTTLTRQQFINIIMDNNNLNGGMFIGEGRTTVSVCWVTV